jgi:hypothetical protein
MLLGLHLIIILTTLTIILALIKFVLSFVSALNIFDLLDLADSFGSSGGGQASEKEKFGKRQEKDLCPYQRYVDELRQLISSEYLVASALAAGEMTCKESGVFNSSQEEALSGKLAKIEESKEKIHSAVIPHIEPNYSVCATNLADRVYIDRGANIYIAPEIPSFDYQLPRMFFVANDEVEGRVL